MPLARLIILHSHDSMGAHNETIGCLTAEDLGTALYQVKGFIWSPDKNRKIDKMYVAKEVAIQLQGVPI